MTVTTSTISGDQSGWEVASGTAEVPTARIGHAARSSGLVAVRVSPSAAAGRSARKCAVTVVPFPTLDAINSLPPWAFVIPLQMARPKPVPLI